MNLRTWWRHGLLPASLLLLVAITHTVSTETRVVCYYTNWSVYRPGTAKFSPQNINPYLCTHLIYAFGGFTKENSLKPFDKYQDIEKGGYAKFTGLKTYNKNLKTMLAIGGWNEGSSRFSPMVASADRRKELVKNAVKFLRQNHFDGLDLDWEYPSFRDGGKPRDRENYAQLVQELREEFDRESQKTGRPRLLLTMAVPAGIEYINKGYDVPKLTKYLDWMNILSYDYHSAFEPAVNHHSPLYPLEEENEYNYDTELNIDHTIKHYLEAGADPKKLVLGIPTYGRSYTLFNPDANEIGAPADGPGDMGDATRENGYLAYYEICENIKENNWKVIQPNPDAMGPYAYKDNQWVSYDDDLIVRKKSEYVVENGLGGIMFWAIDNDDFRGNCYNKPYPLIEAAKEALITAASGKTDDNLVSAPSKKPRKPATRQRTRIGTSSKSESSTVATRVQNSGGRQGGDDLPSSGSGRKRIRPSSRGKPRAEDVQDEKEVQVKQQRLRPRGSGRRRRPTTTAATTVTSTTPSTLPTTPMYRTPEPPTTPDPGGDFKCEEDGFFPHPRDCKKYFWCLSGPADVGIVAHAFTCPAGLYFNKLADSCDYTQNVLCNKNKKTATTTTTSTTPSTTTTTTRAPPSTTTRRASPRITAATSRTTFVLSTTTTTEEPEYYDEYEYEDEEFEDDAPRRGEPDAEEDPKVIKELIDLIRKVGGVEELEKYLKLQDDGTMAVTSSGSTTPATISRSLYERVLSRANGGKTGTSTSNTSQNRGKVQYSTINRNSRPGPQSQGVDKTENNSEDGSARRGRPQYTTIQRQRASTEKTVDIEDEEEEEEEDEIEEEPKSTKTRQFPSRNQAEDEEDEEKSTKTRQFTSRKTNQPEYVTIRRQRPTATAEPEEETSTRSAVRGRQRGIPGEEEEDTTEGTQGPEYVTIRRTRPSTEEPTTSKYTIINRRRPTTESPEETEEPTDSESSQKRPGLTTQTSDDSDSTRKRVTLTTQTYEDTESPEKEKRYRSTTTAIPEDTSVTTPETDTTSASTPFTTSETSQEPGSTITEATAEVKSTSEDVKTTVETIVSDSTQSPSTELTQSSPDLAQSTTIVQGAEGITESPTSLTDKSNQISDSPSQQTSEKSEKVAPQLFKPRPFATRNRSTTTAKPVTEASESPVKKVSESTGPRLATPSRPLVRKFQPGSRFVVNRGQTQTGSKVGSDSNSNVRTTTEENEADTEEGIVEREEERRTRIRNRGNARFRLSTTTVEPVRRRHPSTVRSDVDYDYEELHRTYRPSILADLSSLTSADIAFQKNNARKHIRRRPVSASTTTTTTTEGPTEPSLKTGPRTLPLARKLISETTFGRTSRRLQRPNIQSSSTTTTTEEPTTKSASPFKPRPAYSNLVRTTTTSTGKPTEQIETTPEKSDTETVEIANRFRTIPPPLIHIPAGNETTDENNDEITSTTTNEQDVVSDSTESNSDKDYKTLKPDTESNNELTDPTTVVNDQESTVPTAELQEQSPVTRTILNRVKSTTVASTDVTETAIPEVPKLVNRTRKVVIGNRRFRTTTTAPNEPDDVSNISVKPFEAKRPRPSFLSLRNNQTTNRLAVNITRPSVTRLRPVKPENDEPETNNTAETNRSLIKRIRPFGLAAKVDDEEKIKLSETNISENDYTGTVRNLPEDDSGKYRRRKIIRRVRPSKDTAFSKTDEDEIRGKRIRISDKSVLKNEEETTEQRETTRVRPGLRNLFAGRTTTERNFEKEEEDNDEEEDQNKRIRPGTETLFSKSESTDILRSKRIRYNGKSETESNTENINNEDDDNEKIQRIRPGKGSLVYKTETDEFRNKRIRGNGSTDENKDNEEETEEDSKTTTVTETDEIKITSTQYENKESTTNETEKDIEITEEDKDSTTAETESEKGTKIRTFKPVSGTLSYKSETNDFRAKLIRLNNNDNNEDATEEDSTTQIKEQTTETEVAEPENDENNDKVKKVRPTLFKPADLRNKRLRLNGNIKTEEELEESDKENSKRVRVTGDRTTTIESVSTIRNRNLVRKFRPGQITDTTDSISNENKVRLNLKLLENNRAVNRTRKVIKRIRPITTTTTESEVPSSTVSTTPEISITTETNSLVPEVETPTEIPEDDIIPTTESDVETTEYTMTTIDDGETTILFTTEAEVTTTTSTTPRPTRPSLIGRSRPAYRPRNRGSVEIRSTTPGVLGFRRKFNPLNRNESSTKQETDKEVEDGIVDDKLKKLYNKKSKFTPIVRSTTERVKALEIEAEIEEEIKSTSTTTTEKESEVATTIVDGVIDEEPTEKTNEITTNMIAEQTDLTDIPTTEIIPDITEASQDDITSTLLTTEHNQTTTTENITVSETTTVTTESEIKSTTVSKTTTEAVSELDTEKIEQETTESNTEMFEVPTTEYISETNLPEDNTENITPTSQSYLESTTSDSNVSDITTSIDSTTSSDSASTTDISGNKNEPERPYKPIRFKPSDRPKLRIKLNRTETTDSERQDNEDQKSRKFTPSRTLDQRNRSKLAYRKETSTEKSKISGAENDETTPETSPKSFVPTGRKIERPKFSVNQETIDQNKEVETKPVRPFYPTLKPVRERFNFNNEEENEDEDEEEPEEEYEGEITDEQEEQPIENPLIKYLQTIRNNQDIIKVNGQPEDVEVDDNDEEVEPEVEDEPEEYVDEESEDDAAEDVEETPKYNVPTNNKPVPPSRAPAIPAVRVSNRPQYSPKRPAVPNEPRQPISINEPNRPFNTPNEPNRPNSVNESNRAVSVNAPNRPTGGRNYPRRFNKPTYSSSSTTTTTTADGLVGINLEAVNARNKNLYNKNHKTNVPNQGPTSTSSIELQISSSSESTTVNSIETTLRPFISQVTEETILPEPTTEQLSTLHHVFAEPDIPTTPGSTSVSETESSTASVETSTPYNLTAAQLEAARSLERLIEVNRIVEVSFKEDKVKNNSGIVESRVMLEKVPTLDRIGAINRLTVIKVVDGGNETDMSFPANHAVTLNEIVTGRRIEAGPKVDLVAKLHAPDIELTKMNILNNTLEIIEAMKHEEETTTHQDPVYSTETPSTTVVTQPNEPETGPPVIETTTIVTEVVTAQVLDRVINHTVVHESNRQERKFEINSKSNVVDYSHRELDPIQIIASAQPSNEASTGKKLAIDSKSVVSNNYNSRPVFHEPTTLPLEALFQTDYSLLKESGSVTQLPTLKEVVTGRGNFVDDDQDLLESRHVNGRVRIRILGEDEDYSRSYEQSGEPVFAPIRILQDEKSSEVFTLKAEVVEVTAKPNVETIRIAPIAVSVSKPEISRVPVFRVESSQSSSHGGDSNKAAPVLSASPKLNLRVLKDETISKNPVANSVPAKRELQQEKPTSFFNADVIFGEAKGTENAKRE